MGEVEGVRREKINKSANCTQLSYDKTSGRFWEKAVNNVKDNLTP
jgi:hypothetical protein